MEARQARRRQLGASNWVTLSVQLHELKQQPKETLREYADRARGYWSQLNAFEGHEFPEHMAVLFMIQGVKQQMVPGTVAVLHQHYLLPDRPTATFDAVMPGLLCYEWMMSQHQADTDSALPSQARNSKHQQAKGGCQNSKGSSRNIRSKKRGCFHCGGDHYIRNCPQLAGERAATASAPGTGASLQRTEKSVTVSRPAEQWVVASGATQHVCHSRSAFTTYRTVTGKTVDIGNGQVEPVQGQGTVTLQISQSMAFTLKSVLHVEAAAMNLLSVRKAAIAGVEVSFFKDKCTLRRDGVTLATAQTRGGLYTIKAWTGRSSSTESGSCKCKGVVNDNKCTGVM